MYRSSVKGAKTDRFLRVIFPNGKKGRSVVSFMFLMRPCAFLCSPKRCGLMTSVISTGYITIGLRHIKVDWLSFIIIKTKQKKRF